MNRLSVFFCICLAAPASAKEALFTPGPDVAVGTGSGSVFLADLNRDGNIDMVTQHLLHQKIAVHFGNGKGRFSKGAEIKLAYQPGAATLADVNNDGLLDLGVANRDDTGEYIRILLGDGRGGFAQPGSPVRVSGSMKLYKPSLFFVDINEDAKLDAVTANGRRNTIEILFGDGRGHFLVGPTVGLAPRGDTYNFAPADIDGDRHVDLVIVGSVDQSSGSPSVLFASFGDGKGGFTPSSTLTIAPGAHFVTLADIDADRRPDAVISHDGALISVFLNKGARTLSPAPASPYRLAGGEVFATAAGDVNRDGRTDIVAATVDSITVLLGSSAGLAPAADPPYDAGPGAYNLSLGDINGDGKLDVAASSFEGDVVTMLLRTTGR